MKKLILIAILSVALPFLAMARTVTWDKGPYHYTLNYDEQGRLVQVYAAMRIAAYPRLVTFLDAEVAYSKSGFPFSVVINGMRIGCKFTPGRRPYFDFVGLGLPGLAIVQAEEPLGYLLPSSPVQYRKYLEHQNRALLQFVLEVGTGLYRIAGLRSGSWGSRRDDFIEGAEQGLRELGRDVRTGVTIGTAVAPPGLKSLGAKIGYLAGAAYNIGKNVKRGIDLMREEN